MRFQKGLQQATRIWKCCTELIVDRPNRARSKTGGTVREPETHQSTVERRNNDLCLSLFYFVGDSVLQKHLLTQVTAFSKPGLQFNP